MTAPSYMVEYHHLKHISPRPSVKRRFSSVRLFLILLECRVCPQGQLIVGVEFLEGDEHRIFQVLDSNGSLNQPLRRIAFL